MRKAPAPAEYLLWDFGEEDELDEEIENYSVIPNLMDESNS
jgi:hypothetical protein